MFGEGDFPIVTMADVCRIITDGTHQPPKFTDTGIPFLLVSNITTDEVTYNAQKFISESSYNELIKRTPIEIGDILLSTVGSYGHPAIVKELRPFCFQRHIAYLKPDFGKVLSRYLHAAILSDSVKAQIEKKVKGIAQKTLNLSEIRKLQIPLPPLAIQREFAAFISKLDKSQFGNRSSQIPMVREFDVVLIYKRILHRRVDLRMSKQFLDLLDGHSLVDGARGERPSELVRVDPA